jgi:hypothetical protein
MTAISATRAKVRQRRRSRSKKRSKESSVDMRDADLLQVLLHDDHQQGKEKADTVLISTTSQRIG